MRRQLGISLIEVLVSSVVISIALLGMMKLQIVSLQANQSAYSVSQANLLGYDILERMRVNSASPVTQYFNLTGVKKDCQIYSASDPKPNCSSADMAKDDIFQWQQDLARQLPNGNGLVCHSDLAGDVAGIPDCEANGSNHPIVVYIWWLDRNSNALTQLAISGES